MRPRTSSVPDLQHQTEEAFDCERKHRSRRDRDEHDEGRHHTEHVAGLALVAIFVGDVH